MSKKNPVKRFVEWLTDRLSVEDAGTPITVDFLRKLLTEWKSLSDIFDR